MKVISEEKLCDYLGQVLLLSRDVLERIPQHGTEPVADDILDRFHSFVNLLNQERDNDSFLNDESWNWIWESKASYNAIQVYGRLAWINLQLLELL